MFCLLIGFCFSDSVFLNLQSNVGSISGPQSVYRIGVPSPTCSSVKLRRLPLPSDSSSSLLSFASGSFRISPLTSSLSNRSSRRRPGLLSSVRASAEVGVFFQCKLNYDHLATAIMRTTKGN